jgi:hypothetical protein
MSKRKKSPQPSAGRPVQVVVASSAPSPLSILAKPWAAFVLALVVYALVTMMKGDFGRSSRWNFYPYLADAFMHGQLHLRVLPRTTHDLSLFNDQYYLYWPPLPAFLMMPFVWIGGLEISDFLFNTLVGAINVGLVTAVVRSARDRGLFDLTDDRIGLLSLFFAFGTVHFGLAVGGGVWNTGQLVGFAWVACVYLIAILAAGWWAFLLAGIAVAASLTTRSHLFLAAIWPAYELLRRHWTRGIPYAIGCSALGLAPVILAGAAFAAYNHARFGSVTDVGINHHLMHEHFRDGFEKYGTFSIHFAPKNLYYQFLAYPLPLRSESLEGGSLFLMSPIFFAAFWAFRRPTASTWVLLATCVVTYIPIMMLLGTGWQQWGPRYLLDFTLPLMLLVAIGIRLWPLPIALLLAAVSVVHYGIGVAWRQ